MNTVLDGLAENPALPAALLDRLIAAADPVLGADLAGRPDLSDAQVRALLARDDPAIVSVLLAKGRVRTADVPLTNPAVALAVTEAPDAPPAAARALAQHPDFKARLPEWARTLPPDVIDLLAHDPDEHVVAELVTFHALPASSAQELSRHPSTEVRRALAASPHTPADVLVRLGSFARELAGNPATPPSAAADLVRDHRARYQLATRPDLPPHVYEQLAADVEPGVLAALATNPAVPASVLRQLTGTRALQRVLVRNPAIPLDLLAELAATARIGPEPVPRVASASEAELRTLAATVKGRMLVARRADLPLDMVEQLVSDPDPAVAAAIVTNPLVPVDQLWALVERHGARLYPRAARNLSCPPELLHHMALRAAGVEETWRAVARHPHALGETLLLCLEDAQARHLAAAHPHLPVEKIVELLGSEFTARPAAANPSLPVHVMEELLDRSGA
ncbi:hypothetical protein C8D88_105588 [Lentzea atacamensis]|uniref:Leucine rich repeat variant n=1 Tax=Lentzea atacamensis TaxID=531938 RepID=A0A316HZF6_9PSEU|nr:hypothetical protein [Lentzea atacamensis]PWK86539.1 hypothetical protein C8D88_105588 [Lentzea atacamensis]